MVAANYHFAWFRALAAGSPANSPADGHAAPAAWSQRPFRGHRRRAKRSVRTANHELTLLSGGSDTEMVSGPSGRAKLSDDNDGDSHTDSDRDVVEAVLRDLSEAADRWEALVAEAEATTYSVDLGDIHAVANADGRLLELELHPGVVTDYTHDELAGRLNLAFAALRGEAETDYQARYGGGFG